VTSGKECRKEEDLGRACSAFRDLELNGLFDESGPQAPGAYPDTLGVPIHERTNGLKVRVKDTFGLIVGMTDVMPGLRSFSTKVTYECHRYSFTLYCHRVD
jgi:hypothetical protein